MGGRGLRIVRTEAEFKPAYERASNEALQAFGDGRMFLEKYIENPRHIEIQILADTYGNTVHLYERDCSVQRRHQKIIEVAPSVGIEEKRRLAMCEDAKKIAKHVGYVNAGTGGVHARPGRAALLPGGEPQGEETRLADAKKIAKHSGNRRLSEVCQEDTKSVAVVNEVLNYGADFVLGPGKAAGRQKSDRMSFCLAEVDREAAKRDAFQKIEESSIGDGGDDGRGG
mmetsp:Transcript_1059/g.3304  ORF Transcript_1059/g.3304 Transcript_1059/m.3304 type:complete len:227 (-) Transcript_1059:722-1402(-)